jgi:hypothetical protein
MSTILLEFVVTARAMSLLPQRHVHVVVRENDAQHRISSLAKSKSFAVLVRLPRSLVLQASQRERI